MKRTTRCSPLLLEAIKEIKRSGGKFKTIPRKKRIEIFSRINRELAPLNRESKRKRAASEKSARDRIFNR
jgi:hypothetical protein